MLTIAILSLIGLVIGIIYDCAQAMEPRGYAFCTTISTIAWWNICFPLALVILIIGSIWFLIALYEKIV